MSLPDIAPCRIPPALPHIGTPLTICTANIKQKKLTHKKISFHIPQPPKKKAKLPLRPHHALHQKLPLAR